MNGPDPTVDESAVRAAHQQVIKRFAVDVLRAAVHCDDDRVQELLRGHGEPTAVDLVRMACFWADAAAAVFLDDVTEPDRPIELRFRNVDNGTESGADDVPPQVAWAGRLIAARAARDEPQQKALIAVLRQLPADAVLAHVEAVLHTATLMVQRAKHHTGGAG